MRPRLSKTILILLFTFVSAAVAHIYLTDIPAGPWDGMYPIFDVAWVLLTLAAVGLLIVRPHPRIRALGAVLITAAIALMTLRWGTVFGIRDPWIHIAYLRDRNYHTSSRYPSFQSSLDVLETVSGVQVEVLLPYLSLFAAVVGVALLAAVASRLTNNRNLAATASVVFFPTVLVGFYDRPITLAAILTLTVIWLMLSPLDDLLKIPTLAVTITISLLYHPLTGLLVVLLAGSAFAWTHIAAKTNWYRMGSAPPQMRRTTTYTFLLLISTVFVAYFFYFRTVGVDMAAGTLLSIMADTESAIASGTESTPLLYQLPGHMLDAASMAGITICAGIAAVTGLTLSGRDTTGRFIALLALTAAGCLTSIFGLVDVLTPTGFSAIRALPLAPILLVLGAIVAVQELDGRGRRVAVPVLTVLLVVSLATIFPSPLTGTVQQSSVPSDVERTEWLIDHHGSNHVIEAENTYEIAHAKYGNDGVDELSGGNTWEYQSTTREETYSWQVEPAQRALVVNHDLSRIHAIDNNLSHEQAQYEQTHDKVYASGTSDVYVDQ